MAHSLALEDFFHPYLGRYMGAPDWVKATAGRAYRSIPPAMRLGPAYGQFRGEVALGAVNPLHKLEQSLAWALETVPAYARFKSLAKSMGDPRELLAQLPVTDKLDIKRCPDHYLSRVPPASARLEMHTGGSTRHPMRFYLQKHVTRPKEYAFMQDFRARVDANTEELVLSLRGRTVPTACEPDGRLWMLEPIRRQLILSCDHLELRYMPRYAEALAQHRPTIIEAFPSALHPLARWLTQNPLPEFTRGVRAVLLFSENVHDAQVAAIRQAFGCPVIAHYGHSERVLMAGSLPEDPRYFFYPQYGHFELLDHEDRPVTKPGQVGFIVGTSFDNQVHPFIRYRTGDMGVLSEDGHAELPGYPTCARILGRMQEFVVCRDHRLVSITTLGVAHFAELDPAEAIQYEQREPGMVTLKVAAPEALSPETLRRIATAVERKTQGGCEVQAIQVPRIERTPRGKVRMIVQHLDVRSYFGASGAE